MNSFPPGIILIVAALIVALPWVKGVAKPAIGLLAALACLGLVFTTYSLDIGYQGDSFAFINGHALGQAFGMEGGIQLTWMQINGPTKIFATIFSLMACVGILFAFNQKRPTEMCGALLYAGSAICATYSGDLISMFIFWELMAVGSTLIILDGGQLNSARAGMRYVAVHFVGGAILMVGIIWYGLVQQDLSIFADPLQSGLVDFNKTLAHPAAWLMLIGILINTGVPPFGAWLPEAYPEGSPSGTVFLSAYTTKTAVFVLMMLFSGTQLLMWVGMFMAAYGIVYAILENDIRRILAYSIINQVGFMVCAVGIGTELSLCGASAHAFAHIIYKALLLMAAGSVIYMTGKRQCTDLGGLYKTMRWTMIFCAIGALAMAAPLTAGFTSKSMIITAAAEIAAIGGEHALLYAAVWFVLIGASAGVFLTAGMKFSWFVFFQKDAGLRPSDPPKNMFAAMAILAVLCVVFGFPGVSQHTIYKILPYAPTMVDHSAHGSAHGSTHHAAVHATDDGAHEQVHGSDLHAVADAHAHADTHAIHNAGSHDAAVPARIPYNTWSAHHVITQCSILIASGLAFFVLLNMFKRALTITLDADWFYRTLCPMFWRGILLPPLRLLGIGHHWVLAKLPGLVTDTIHAKGVDVSVNHELEFGGSRCDVGLNIRTNRYRQWAVGGAMVVISAMLLIYLLCVLWG